LFKVQGSKLLEVNCYLLLFFVISGYALAKAYSTCPVKDKKFIQ